jgi:P27 family predicted phage terminase small subunit
MKKSGRTLSPEAKAWWRELVEAFEIEDAAGQLLLQTAMEAFDAMREAQTLIERDGLTLKDRFGQVRLNPAALSLRDSRTALLRSLRALNLDIQTPGPIGRPTTI